MGDLTDYQAARLVGKHPRTIQRWCKRGKLPGAWKAGRSWRIPRRALREAGLGAALERDDVEREIRAAIQVCEELSGELKGLTEGRPPPVTRNWRGLARLLGELEKSLTDLARLASRVPEKYSSRP